jgi:molybdenum-dependent DNA-binding transcriptional regulator ModE
VANLDDLRIFSKVAQFRSISQAARSLGMPNSTVSRRLSVLESKLGVSLLRRTTRRVTLTEQGREYFSHCKEPMTLLEDAEQTLTRGQKIPEGKLRMSVPVILGQDPFLKFLSPASSRLSARSRSTFSSPIYSSIWWRKTSTLRSASESCRTRAWSPSGWGEAFATWWPLPIEPADLKQHACVMLNARNNETDWDLVSGRKSPALMSPDRYRVATSIPSAHSCTGKAAKDRATNLQYPLVAAQWSPHAFDRWR